MNKAEQPIYEFGSFRLNPAQRVLLRDGALVPLQPKALETLLVLVERHGQVVSKEELMRRVWPDAAVEEINLTKNISILRKTLANGNGHDEEQPEFIVTLAKRGYRFVAEVREWQETITASPERQKRRRTGLRFGLPVLAISVLCICLWLFVPMPKRLPADQSGSANPAAARLYHEGRRLWNQRTIEGLNQSVTCFEQATKLDPSYARAWAGLADAWSMLGEYEIKPALEAYAQAQAAAAQAVALDDKLAEAHAALAMVKTNYEWDWPGAEAEFRRALALDPNYATAHQWYAEYLSGMGRHAEALEAIRRAQALAPHSLIIQSVEAWILYFARQYDQMIAHAQQVLKTNPNFAEAHGYLGHAYEQKGMYREAMDAFQRYSDLMGNNTPAARTIRAAAIVSAADYWGRREELESVQPTSSNFAKAEALARLGDKDGAFVLLEQALAERSPQILRLKTHPNLDPLRTDPRFLELLRRAKLAP